MFRYNSFTMIHKALRAMLYDAALTLQQTYFADDAEAAIAVSKVKNILHAFEQHAHHEDTMVLPAIEMYEPQLVDAFEQEHVTDQALGDKLQHLLNILGYTTLAEEKVCCGSALCKSFVEFMVFNLEHMAKEETLINQALWKHYTDEQLLLLNQKLAANIPPAEKAATAKWMIRGVNDREAVNWLKGMKQSAPPVVFDQLWDVAENELPEHRFNKVAEGVFGYEAVAV